MEIVCRRLDAATGNPENPRRFRGLPKWAVVRPHPRAGAMEGNPVRHGRCLQIKRCPNCLSLWERPAAGRVRVPSAVATVTKAPSPRPSPRGRGRNTDDIQRGSYTCNAGTEHRWPSEVVPPLPAGYAERLRGTASLVVPICPATAWSGSTTRGSKYSGTSWWSNTRTSSPGRWATDSSW